MADPEAGKVFEEGFTVIAGPENAKVDIVFVHGLQGHPFWTWACEVKQPKTETAAAPSDHRRRSKGSWLSAGIRPNNNVAAPDASTTTITAPAELVVYWPKAPLADEEWCSSARILTYGYDSKVTRGYVAANKNDVFSHARDLLYGLERERPPGRPLIFVVHSLGGILLKETLRRSDVAEEENIKDIVQSTKGIIFLGTPHRGSPGLASLGDIVRRVASTVARVDSNPTLLRSLGTDSPELEIGRESFVALWHKYRFRVKTFQEACGLSGVNVGIANEKIVPDTSSVLDSPEERVETIPANHMDMARFEGPSDPGYRKVSAEIKGMLSACLQALRTHAPPIVPEDVPTSAEKEIQAMLLESLQFSGIYNRLHSIQPALSKTVDWVFASQNYIAWANRINIAKDRGLLWIKGKPGAGKSTLIKAAFLRTRTQQNMTGKSVAAFFFNSRSAQVLERSPVGLYRSLLHQILKQEPGTLSRISKCFLQEHGSAMEQEGYTVNWHEGELKDYLSQVLVTQRSRPVTVFIDAIDECEDDEVRDLVSYFSRLVKNACQLGAELNVCLSSRHYPQISIDGCPEITVEEHNHQDILRYIESEAEDYSLINGVKEKIAEKSRGVFLWVVLAISILKRSGRGKSHKWLEKKLDELPAGLESIFSQIISDVKEEDLPKIINLMQIVLFARRSLSPFEIHLISSFSLHHYESVAAWKCSVEYLETEKSRHEMIIELSKGLLELNSNKKYQFIHETVREFFLSGVGFKLLKLRTESIVGSGNESIAWACARIMTTTDFFELCPLFPRPYFMERLESENYASVYLLDHVEDAIAAGDFGVPVLKYLKARNLDMWGFPFNGRYPGANVLLAALMKSLLRVATKLYAIGVDINARDCQDRTFLHLISLKSVKREMVTWLVSNGANVHARDKDGCTPLASIFFSPLRDLEKVWILIEAGSDINVTNNRGERILDLLRQVCAYRKRHPEIFHEPDKYHGPGGPDNCAVAAIESLVSRSSPPPQDPEVQSRAGDGMVVSGEAVAPVASFNNHHKVPHDAGPPRFFEGSIG